MLRDRLRGHLGKNELDRIVGEAGSTKRRISASIISPLCRALELAAIDGNIPGSQEKLPRRIVQFWDQETIPADVAACMATWRAIPDFEYLLFDEVRARDFIRTEYEGRHLEAYDLCNHPAMKSDFFRLAWLYRHGGVYIDADDACEGPNLDRLFREDGIFRLRSATFRKNPSDAPATIFNNNPIFSLPNDDILRKALERATMIMLSLGKRDFYNMLVITGPLNLSIAVYATALDCIANDAEFRFCPIIGWDEQAKKSGQMAYQKTKRNWRVAQDIHRDANEQK
jgi:hypothetical protein